MPELLSDLGPNRIPLTSYLDRMIKIGKEI